jgi:hypothetical protein
LATFRVEPNRGRALDALVDRLIASDPSTGEPLIQPLLERFLKVMSDGTQTELPRHIPSDVASVQNFPAGSHNPSDVDDWDANEAFMIEQSNVEKLEGQVLELGPALEA